MINEIFERCEREVPRDYLCIGLLTTGLEFGHTAQDCPDGAGDDLIVQLGHCDVKDEHAVARGSSMLNWTRATEYIDLRWLRQKMADVAEKMREQGRHFPLTLDAIEQSECEPAETLHRYATMLEDAITGEKMIVGHNLIGFGVPVLRDATAEWLGRSLEIPPESILDLGVIEKARQIREYPMPGESMHAYFRRVYAMRVNGVRWGMDHCRKAYGLHNVRNTNKKLTGGAGFHAYLCYRLLEAMRHTDADGRRTERSRVRAQKRKASPAGTQAAGTIPLEERKGKLWELVRKLKKQTKKEEKAKRQQAATSRTPYPIITYNGVKYSCMVDGNVAFWRHADATDSSWVDVGGKPEQLIRRAWKQHISAGCASPNNGKTRFAG